MSRYEKQVKFARPSQAQITAWVNANFDAKSRRGGVELCIDNPFDGDTGRNFNIETTTARVHDWRGDGWVQIRAPGDKPGHVYKPTFLRFVQLYRNCTFQEAIKEVCGENVSLSAIEYQLKRQSKETRSEPEGEMQLPQGSIKILESPQKVMTSILIKWLKSRGIDEERIEKYDIHHFADDVIWPYYEYEELVYWQSRNRINKVFRFPDSSCGVTKGMFLYGFDYVEPSDYVVITEAIFGAITLEEQCLASGGASLTKDQIRKIRALNPVKGVILAPDNDKAGLASVVHNYELIKPYHPVFYSIPPKLPYNDDGEIKYTKDWNELLTGVKMNRGEIRKTFESGVKRVTIPEMKRILDLCAEPA